MVFFCFFFPNNYLIVHAPVIHTAVTVTDMDETYSFDVAAEKYFGNTNSSIIVTVIVMPMCRNNRLPWPLKPRARKKP